MEKPSNVEVADAMATVAEELVKPTPPETWRQKLMRYAGALFFEKKEGKWVISIGRISWWLAFSPALWIWIENMGGDKDITEHHLTVLLLLAGYNFGKKVVDGFASKKKESEADGPG